MWLGALRGVNKPFRGGSKRFRCEKVSLRGVKVSVRREKVSLCAVRRRYRDARGGYPYLEWVIARSCVRAVALGCRLPGPVFREEHSGAGTSGGVLPGVVGADAWGSAGRLTASVGFRHVCRTFEPSNKRADFRFPSKRTPRSGWLGSSEAKPPDETLERGPWSVVWGLRSATLYSDPSHPPPALM